MGKVKILSVKATLGGLNAQKLEDLVNEFLVENKGRIEVLNIKYTSAAAIVSVLIYYKEV